jgi:hypothetical protein
VAACREVVLKQMDLSLNDGELVVEVTQAVVVTAVTLDLGECVPVVEVMDGVTERVVGGRGAIEECVEPDGEWIGDVMGIRGREE